MRITCYVPHMPERDQANERNTVTYLERRSKRTLIGRFNGSVYLKTDVCINSVDEGGTPHDFERLLVSSRGEQYIRGGYT